MSLTANQKHELLVLLWNFMYDIPEYPDRVLTGHGTKTREGLLASIEGITEEGRS